MLLAAVMAAPVLPAQQNDTEAQLRKALGGSIRTDEDRHADTYRMPVETLMFFGLRDDMRVLELIPAAGYWVKIMGPVLAEKGKLYEGADGESVSDKLAGWGLTKVEVLDDKFEMTRTGKRGENDVAPFAFPVKDLDMVLTFRNMHNISPEGRKVLNTAVFNALKPGGIYGVVDHTRRHMEPWIAGSIRSP
jgi:predicted methyltransferase